MAKPKIALVPSAQGSKFYSVLPSSGVGDFTFSRSGSATRINSQGLIETVGNGVSRLNYPMIDGVVSGCPHHILEPQRTNLITNSEDLSGYSSTNLDIISNQNISPSGVLNGTFLRPTTANSRHQIYQNASLTAGTNTLSVFIKAGNYSKFRLYFYDGTTAHEVKGDSSNGTIHSTNSTVKVESYGNGWYRYSVTATNVTYSVGNYTVRVTNESYQDDWVANGVDGLYIFGLQFENGSYPTSYIPTNGSAVTRSAETATGSGDAATFNDSEGVLMAEISGFVDDGSIRYLQIYNSQNISQRLFLRYDNAGNRIKVAYINNSIAIYVATYDDFNITDYNKISFKWSNSDFNLYVNGFKVDEQLSGSTGNSSLDSLDFKQFTGSFPFYGNTKQLQYFDTALTDSELETLTSWVSFQDMANSQLYSVE